MMGRRSMRTGTQRTRPRLQGQHTGPTVQPFARTVWRIVPWDPRHGREDSYGVGDSTASLPIFLAMPTSAALESWPEDVRAPPRRLAKTHLTEWVLDGCDDDGELASNRCGCLAMLL